MKPNRWLINSIALLAVASASAVIGQSTFSGIYSGSQLSDGKKVWVALTKGGRGLGLSEVSRGIQDALSPATTTVTSDGRFKGITTNGETIVTGRISSDFKFTGTVSWDGGSSRLVAKRIYR